MRSESVIQNCQCDQKGRRLSWETRVEEVGFEVFPKRCDRGTVSYLEGERVPKNWGIVTERIREVSTIKRNLSLGVLCLVFLEEV